MSFNFPPPAFFRLQPYMSTLVPGLLDLVTAGRYGPARQVAYSHQRDRLFGTLGAETCLKLLTSAARLAQTL
ncbi:MAG: hypothetical protein KME03_10160 [Aphanocapsa lilacina HA4352-LM1]|nr:hypothetical protein [Aphanocapsa lilacina HA4352-LM1]